LGRLDPTTKNIDLRRWKEKRGDAVKLDSRETGRKVKCRGRQDLESLSL